MSQVRERIVVGPDGLTGIVDELDRAGYEVWGPAVRDGTVVTRRLRPGDRLPVGFASDQAPGSYRLVETDDRSRFGWAVGPQPWKPLLHPPSIATMHLAQPSIDEPVTVSVVGRPAAPFALFGMRPCDLAALDKLDRVLLDAPPSADPTYRSRRRDAFLVVVNCGIPASTCFCTSLDTGPHVDERSDSHDLEVTELVGPDPSADPDYVVAAISTRGSAVLERVADRLATDIVSEPHRAAIASQRASAAEAIERHLPADRVEAALADAHHSQRWNDVAEQCLACGNCTAVCPTCFCTTINDIGDLSGSHVERRREWESCFSLEFSRVGTDPVRSTRVSRYRQWMTHKLGTWHDQFGESGCVGCGRCTTWCPAGIDFVDVVQHIVDDAGVR